MTDSEIENILHGSYIDENDLKKLNKNDIVQIMKYLTEESDLEKAHSIADQLLCRYIELTDNNRELLNAYDEVGKGYA